ncbi:peptidase S10 [Hyphomonas sp.]|uniref:S10 family peptidase n=1 Tax=Hyphomonas sp. TaxID=87 RepID=UPI001D42E178|nr:peptidase S10 [Hyphomonas sp.]MBU3922401.1 peptidase S10 [Alphaproteobacteria bacterium]MBU4063170.1 peptidase S10 [Alphaproteobacteria bacterium]MBU4164487.1 peptidase S10 [Alphaproteobacteria bacterium]
MMIRTAFLALVMVCAAPAFAAPSNSAAEGKTETDAPAMPVPEPVMFTSMHTGVFGGQKISYRVEAGETQIRNAEGEPAASLFTISYIRENVSGPRPVSFVFNGGPGSASVWLHLGLLGPKRVQVASNADADDGAAPYALLDNPLSILDVTDLVFIDPVGTGYSRVVGTGEDKDYWSEEGDGSSLAEFIRIWITGHKRWNAPKYLIGESFGTTRAAYLAHRMITGDVDIALNGLVMISQALDYEGSTSAHDNVYSYITYLPSMAAAAQYHGKAGAGVAQAQFLAEARAFARDEYGPALLKGAQLTPDERARIRDRLAYFTGLDPAYIETSDLRILMHRFQKELLRDKGVALGRLDGRYMGDEADDAAEGPESDVASYAVGSAYSALMNQYLSADLGVAMDRPYMVSSEDAGNNWNFSDAPEGEYAEPHYVNVGRKLSTAMRQNTGMKVWVASGYYDLITPFFDSEITFGRYGIPQERVAMTYYQAGHMMYLNEGALAALAADLRTFYTGKLEDDRPQ